MLSPIGSSRYMPISHTSTTLTEYSNALDPGKRFAGECNKCYASSQIKVCKLTHIAPFSDPWWIYTTCSLFWVIKSQYDFGIIELIRVSPRFGVMLFSMCLSIIFLVLDLLSVLHVMDAILPTGLNPFWKVSIIVPLCSRITHHTDSATNEPSYPSSLSVFATA